ncbi:transglycosylase SLT domain protein [Edwardsiella piscicida]|uniref:Invasion protein iagB n=2 Tax=Edwardsiella anguillarum TaxID=1821960 RepID=A0A076LM33_9GAMM|nr:invasion protein iagB [Edwardsiella anguillarum ET080813]GAJ68504.1 transglycosylase SLT domain protein [Edwardsiella piscicida]
MINDMRNFIFICLFVFSFSSAYAAKSDFLNDCFVRAGQSYNISPILLKAIAIQESNLSSHVVSKMNANGTYDVGIMQINSFHFEKLKKMGITEDDLINDPCVNIFVGAYILAMNIKSNGATWESVGAYNAGYGKSLTSILNKEKYARLVFESYQKISPKGPQ